MHPSKGVQKNMLKTWNFTEKRLCHRYFHDNLQETSRTSILQIGTGQALLIVVLMVGSWTKLQMEIVD